jgi:hypothetical protein
LKKLGVQDEELIDIRKFAVMEANEFFKEDKVNFIKFDRVIDLAKKIEEYILTGNES